MRISWIIATPPVRQADGTLTSDVASIRYRVLNPIRFMDQQAYVHQLVAMLKAAPEEVREKALNADVMIFSKSFLPSNAALAEDARSRGVRVIVDVCDNHYEDSDHSEHYRKLSQLADVVVCNSAEMARAAEPYCGAAPVVIEDPYEGPQGEPRFSPGGVLKLLWFGHDSNLVSLQDSLDDLLQYSLGQPIALTVLTRVGEKLKRACGQVNERFGSHFTMVARPWSLEAQRQELADCDVVVIPSLQNAKKQTKSANRMIEALRAGRPVVAQVVPAYEPFGRWTPVSATLSEGLAWLFAHRDEVADRVAQAQRHIEAGYAPEALGGEWDRLIKAQFSQRVRAG